MSRGKAEFVVGKMIDTNLSSDFKQPKFEHKLDISYDSKGDDKYYELDPVTRINKGFCFDDDLEIKGGGAMSYGDTDEGNKLWEKHREKRLEETSRFNKPYQSPQGGNYEGSKTPTKPLDAPATVKSQRSGGSVETIMPTIPEKPEVAKPKLSASQRIKQGFTDLKSKIGQGVSSAGQRFGKLSTPSKVGVIGAVGTGIAGLGYMGARSVSQPKEDLEYKGLVPQLIPDKWKRRGEMAIASGVIAANPKRTMIGEYLNEEKEEIPEIKNKNFKEGMKRWGTPLAIGSVTGVIGGDIANRMQDRRHKKDKDGLVKSIVDELKKKE